MQIGSMEKSITHSRIQDAATERVTFHLGLNSCLKGLNSSKHENISKHIIQYISFDTRIEKAWSNLQTCECKRFEQDLIWIRCCSENNAMAVAYIHLGLKQKTTIPTGSCFDNVNQERQCIDYDTEMLQQPFVCPRTNATSWSKPWEILLDMYSVVFS